MQIDFHFLWLPLKNNKDDKLANMTGKFLKFVYIKADIAKIWGTKNK